MRLLKHFTALKKAGDDEDAANEDGDNDDDDDLSTLQFFDTHYPFKNLHLI